jgi:hypothetical protein
LYGRSEAGSLPRWLPSRHCLRSDGMADLPEHRIVLDLPDGSLWGWTRRPRPRTGPYLACFTHPGGWLVLVDDGEVGRSAGNIPDDVMVAIRVVVSERKADIEALWARDAWGSP